MAEHSRYNVSNKGADIYENGVLKNKLGIRDQKILDDHETLLVADTYDHFSQLLGKKGLTFNVRLLFDLHAYWLNNLYTWAGSTRNIDTSKEGTMFCPAKNNAIHPFREGNGRLIRLFIDLIAQSIDYDTVNYGNKD